MLQSHSLLTYKMCLRNHKPLTCTSSMQYKTGSDKTEQNPEWDHKTLVKMFLTLGKESISTKVEGLALLCLAMSKLIVVISTKL